MGAVPVHRIKTQHENPGSPSTCRFQQRPLMLGPLQVAKNQVCNPPTDTSLFYTEIGQQCWRQVKHGAAGRMWGSLVLLENSQSPTRGYIQ